MRFALVALCFFVIPGIGTAYAGKSSSGKVLALGSKAKREKSYQTDTRKRSVFAKYISKGRNQKPKSMPEWFDRSSTRASGFFGNIPIGTVLEGDIGAESPIVFPPNMYFLTCTVTGSGLGDMTILYDHCSGTSNNYCTIKVEITPSSLGIKSVTRHCPWVFYPPPDGVEENPPPVYGHMTNDIYWKGVEVIPPPKNPICKKGSIIRVDNRSLGEYIPLVGIGFGLYYTTEVAHGYASPYADIREYMWRATGFTPTIQHIYDQSRKRLFRGDGSSVEAEYVTISGGNVRVASADGSEIYEFDSNAKHLNTKYALTGTTKYTFNYEATDSQLASITDAFGNATIFNKDVNGNLTSITAPNGQITTLTVDSNTYMMTSLTNPNGETYEFEYDPDPDKE